MWSPTPPAQVRIEEGWWGSKSERVGVRIGDVQGPSRGRMGPNSSGVGSDSGLFWDPNRRRRGSESERLGVRIGDAWGPNRSSLGSESKLFGTDWERCGVRTGGVWGPNRTPLFNPVGVGWLEYIFLNPLKIMIYTLLLGSGTQRPLDFFA